MRKQLTGFEIKAAAKGEVSAVFSTFNVVDSDGDVTLPGAFEDGQEVVISAYGHTSWQGALPVGKGVIRTTETEAILDGKFFLDTAHGRDTFSTVSQLAKSNLGEWSYGFDVIEESRGKHEDRDVRFLKKLKAFEVSPVLLGAGVNTRTLVAKSVEEDGGMTLYDELDGALTVVLKALERTREVVALRVAKGRALAPATAEMVERLHDALAKTAELIPAPTTQVAEVVAIDAVAREKARFLRNLHEGA